MGPIAKDGLCVWLCLFFWLLLSRKHIFLSLHGFIGHGNNIHGHKKSMEKEVISMQLGANKIPSENTTLLKNANKNCMPCNMRGE
jgi:hypothetical protein